MMHRSCEQFFAGSTFAEQQDRRIRPRNALNLLADFANRSVLADDSWEPIARRVLFPEQQVLPQKLLLPRRPLDEQLQMIQVDRLLQEIESTLFHRSNCF